VPVEPTVNTVTDLTVTKCRYTEKLQDPRAEHPTTHHPRKKLEDEYSESMEEEEMEDTKELDKSYLQNVIQALVNFLVVVCDPKMLNNLCLEFLEDGRYKSSICSEGLNSRALFLLSIVLGWCFDGFFLIVMSTVLGGSSPSSTFGGTKGIGGVRPGSRSPFGADPQPEGFFSLSLKRRILS
jgi:hypothetical protein